MPFDPREITPNASLNRVRIIDLPGLSPRYALRHEERGKTAYELLGAKAIFDLMCAHATALKLPLPLPPAPTKDFMRLMHACYQSPDETVSKTALYVRATVHRRIALLLAALRRGDAMNREARPEWDETYWDYWHSVPTIVLGGGTLMVFRTSLQSQVMAFLADFGVSDLEVEFAGHPDVRNSLYLPLIGAGCCAPESALNIAIFDFGGTSVKAGIGHYMLDPLTRAPETLSHIWNVTNTPTPLGKPYSLTAQTEQEKSALFNVMVEHIASTMATSRFLVTHAVVSVAAYIAPNGHPYPNSIGGYAELHTVAPSLQQAFSEAVSARLERPVTIHLIHDGAAAATAYPGKAVIILGTAIGVGTHPAVEQPCNISHFLSLEFT
jgi:hypothetical protein